MNSSVSKKLGRKDIDLTKDTRLRRPMVTLKDVKDYETFCLTVKQLAIAKERGLYMENENGTITVVFFHKDGGYFRRSTFLNRYAQWNFEESSEKYPQGLEASNKFTEDLVKIQAFYNGLLPSLEKNRPNKAQEECKDNEETKLEKVHPNSERSLSLESEGEPSEKRRQKNRIRKCLKKAGKKVKPKERKSSKSNVMQIIKPLNSSRSHLEMLSLSSEQQRSSITSANVPHSLHFFDDEDTNLEVVHAKLPIPSRREHEGYNKSADLARHFQQMETKVEDLTRELKLVSQNNVLLYQRWTETNEKLAFMMKLMISQNSQGPQPLTQTALVGNNQHDFSIPFQLPQFFRPSTQSSFPESHVTYFPPTDASTNIKPTTKEMVNQTKSKSTEVSMYQKSPQNPLVPSSADDQEEEEAQDLPESDVPTLDDFKYVIVEKGIKISTLESMCKGKMLRQFKKFKEELKNFETKFKLTPGKVRRLVWKETPRTQNLLKTCLFEHIIPKDVVFMPNPKNFQRAEIPIKIQLREPVLDSKENILNSSKEEPKQEALHSKFVAEPFAESSIIHTKDGVKKMQITDYEKAVYFAFPVAESISQKEYHPQMKAKVGTKNINPITSLKTFERNAALNNEEQQIMDDIKLYMEKNAATVEVLKKNESTRSASWQSILHRCLNLLLLFENQLRKSHVYEHLTSTIDPIIKQGWQKNLEYSMFVSDDFETRCKFRHKACRFISENGGCKYERYLRYHH